MFQGLSIVIHKLIIALSVASVLGVGCGHVSTPSKVKPSTHPLLDSGGWLDHDRPQIKGRRTRSVAPLRSRPSTARTEVMQVVKNLDALKPMQLREVARSLDLVRAAFAQTTLRQTLGKVRTAKELKPIGAMVIGAFRPGDLVFFQALREVPPVGVIRRQRTDGTLEIIAISRGQLRTIKAHVHRRSRRRANGRILNSFLRTKAPGDAKGTPYLAGQLITAIRRIEGSKVEPPTIGKLD